MFKLSSINRVYSAACEFLRKMSGNIEVSRQDNFQWSLSPTHILNSFLLIHPKLYFMEHFVQSHYQTLLKSLEVIPDVKNLAVKNPGAVADVVKSALIDLKNYFVKNPFSDQNAQIQFFKYEKPVFYGEYIYALELFTIESNKPHGEKLVVRNYYEQELGFIKRFFDQYRFLYQYYLLDGIELDAIYFTPGSKDTDLFLPDVPDLDSDFSTPGDFLFAKFIALERLQDYLITLLYQTADNQNLVQNGDVANLRWTGETINLVEIAYGIWLTGQVNHGNASITEIVEWLEIHFKVKIGLPFRRWFSISKRKRISQTKFIDEIKEAILKRLDEENSLK